jgi:hypothetical protein
MALAARVRVILVGFVCFSSIFFSAHGLEAQQQTLAANPASTTGARPDAWKLYFPPLARVPGSSHMDPSNLDRASHDPALSEVASLRPESALRWRRVSPTAQQPDGPVLYTLIIRSSATANFVPKISPNYSLTNSLILDNGASVNIGALSIAADGTISFKSGQTFPGTGPGTITGVTAGTRLTGGGTSGSVSLALDAPTTTFLNSFGQAPGYGLSSPTGAANYCIVGQLLLFTFTPNGLTSLVPADGRLLPIAGNTALFSLLGTTFGGDGSTNFAVPDMRKLAPNNMTYSICVSGVFP